MVPTVPGSNPAAGLSDVAGEFTVTMETGTSLSKDSDRRVPFLFLKVNFFKMEAWGRRRWERTLSVKIIILKCLINIGAIRNGRREQLTVVYCSMIV